MGATNHPAKKVVGARLQLTSQTVGAARGALGQAVPTHALVAASTASVALPSRACDFVPPEPEHLASETEHHPPPHATPHADIFNIIRVPPFL